MSLPIIKLTKYDLLMGNISPVLEKECLVVFEDTGEMIHWELNKYIDIWTNARIDEYTKLINQMNYNKDNIGYTVDINGKIESPYENTGYSERTTTTDYKYTGCGGSTGSYGGGGASTTYFPDRIVAELRYTSRKEAIDTYSRMTLEVDSKHTLCLSCGSFIHTPKIGKYNDRYCENCGCYLPDSMFGKE